MTLNCRFGRANAAAIVSAVKKHDIAVLALQELTDDLVAQLDAAGLSDLLPYRQLGENKETDNGGFNGVWIRIEPSDMSPVTAVIPAADVPGVCFDAWHHVCFRTSEVADAWMQGMVGGHHRLGGIGDHAEAGRYHRCVG